MKKLTYKLTPMEKQYDKMLCLCAQAQLQKYYVPVSKGHNEYFTREDLAHDFAQLIGSTVKPLD